MKKLFNFRLPIFLVLLLCCGLVSSINYIYDNMFLFALMIAFAILLCGAVFFIISDKLIVKFIILIMLILSFFLGYFGLTIKVNNFKNANLNSHFYNVVGKVIDVKDYDESQGLIVSKCKIDGVRQGKLKYKIALNVLQARQNFEVGDIISFSAPLHDNDIIYENKLSAYNILNDVKYSAMVNLSDVSILGNKANIFERANLFIKDSLASGMKPEQFSVAYAMLTGNDSYIDGQLLTDYRNAGVAHIFAVSGLHIGFLATALGFLVAKTKVNRKIGVLLTITILFLYSGICGFTASSLRAVIMSSVLLCIKLLGDKYDALSSVSIAGFVILAVNPVQLLCVGFQLSFVVVLGIFLLSKPLSKLFFFLPNKISQPISLVLSAQLSSIPICLMQFGEASLFAVIANIVFFPIVSFIFIFLLVSTLIGGIFGISSITLFVPGYILSAINYIVSLIDYDAFIISGISPGGFAILYYFSFILFGGIINIRKKVAISLACVCLLLSCLGTLYNYKTSINQTKMYIVGSDTTCATIIQTPKENILIINSATDKNSYARIANCATRRGIRELDYVLIACNNNIDLHILATKLFEDFSFEHIFYYGEKRQIQEDVAKTFFQDVDFANFKDNQLFATKTIKAQYLYDGYVLYCDIAGQKIAFVSQMNSSPQYSKFNDDCSVIVAVDYCEQIQALNPISKLISYKRTQRFDNGYTRGAFCYNFD